MGDLHPDEIGADKFQGIIEKATADARDAFQTQLQGKVANTAGRFGPQKTAIQAGGDLQNAHLDNQAMFNTWKNKEYLKLYKASDKAGVQVEPTRLGVDADKLLVEVPQKYATWSCRPD